MYFMKTNIFTAFFLTAFFAIAIHAQIVPVPPTPGEETIKISSTLIQIDVTVTDKKGNIINDLKPEEFEIYENGKKQEISNFSFIDILNSQVTVENTNRGKAEKGKNAIPIPPVKLKPEQVRRTYAIVVDDLGLNFENTFWVKQTLKKFVNERMQDGDLVAIIRTSSGIGALQSFTSDKRQLIAAIEKIRWQINGRSGIGTFTPIEKDLKEEINSHSKGGGKIEGSDSDKAFRETIETFRNENFSVGTLGALNYIINGMGDLPGRKAVILFSEGFRTTSSNAPNKVFDAMNVLADLANRSSVVLHTVDPRGLQNPDMVNADDDINEILPSDYDPGSSIDPTANRAANFRESQQSLRYLAEQTGGTAFINQNDIDLGLLKAVNDQSSYYLLGYEPDDETFDPKKNKFNKLEIKVTRPGVKVRYRSGFFGITDKEIDNSPKTPQQKLLAALISPFGASGVNLNIYPVFQNDAKNGNMIQALVYIDANDLKFSQTNDKYKANFDLVGNTFGDNGIQIDSFAQNFTIEVSERVYQNMLKKGFVYALSVPVKKPGAYQFRIALRDTIGDKIGSASQFVEIPNIKKNLAISNILLDNFTDAEWQKVKLTGNRDDSERSILLDATVRQFKRGTILRYDYVVYNPKSNRKIQTQFRLIHDGKVIYEEQPTAIKTNGQTDPTRLQTAGALSLGKNLEPGSYILQIIATDDSNSKKFATQFVEFEIVE